jgi:uncharacterized membrane protein YjjP (DUF1212 family)
MSAPPEREAVSFVLSLGRGLHAAGHPAHRLERMLAAVARRLGLQAHFFSMPTALFASFGDEQEQRTFQVRAEPGSVNLARLAGLHEIATDVAHGRLSPTEGRRRLEALENAPPPYGPALTTASFALASGAAARFLGGSAADVGAGTLIGLAIGLLALAAGRLPALARVFEAVAAVLAALLAALLAAWGLDVAPYLATLSGLIVLVPGFSLTVALTEIATRHLMSGTARLMGALGTFLAIGFGVAAGTRLGTLVGAPAAAVAPGAPLPEWSLWLALLVAPLAFVVLLRAAPRDAWAVLASAVLAFLGARAGARFIGPEIGAFAGALVVGVAGNLYGRRFDRPSAIPVVPGLLLLVPGAVGFQSFSSLLGRETVSGVEAGFRTVLGAASLAMGILFANALVPSRGLDEERGGG